MVKANKFEEVEKFILDADKVLIGIGDDFEMGEYLKKSKDYQKICNHIAEANCQWVMPYVNAYFLRHDEILHKALSNLSEIIENKDYFILSACMNGMLQETTLPMQRIVEPCGSYRLVQIKDKDQYYVTQVESGLLDDIRNCISGVNDWKDLSSTVTFNSLYTDPYCEEGYKDQWAAYTKWLQGTLNQKLCILELGSSMMFASVLRFRFEKIVSLNNKAHLIRINKRLYQIPEEISDRGTSVKENAVEFMAEISKI